MEAAVSTETQKASVSPHTGAMDDRTNLDKPMDDSEKHDSLMAEDMKEGNSRSSHEHHQPRQEPGSSPTMDTQEGASKSEHDQTRPTWVTAHSIDM